MHTWIYKSLRKEKTYLYLIAKEHFDAVPKSLLDLLGTLDFVLDIELTKERRLIHADVNHVMRQLEISGYYLQLPPGDYASERIC